MPYEFYQEEPELEPQTFSARDGGPPRKWTGAGVLDPPFPPKRSPGPIPADSASLGFRILAGLILAGIAVTLFFLLFASH